VGDVASRMAPPGWVCLFVSPTPAQTPILSSFWNGCEGRFSRDDCHGLRLTNTGGCAHWDRYAHIKKVGMHGREGFGRRMGESNGSYHTFGGSMNRYRSFSVVYVRVGRVGTRYVGAFSIGLPLHTPEIWPFYLVGFNRSSFQKYLGIRSRENCTEASCQIADL